MQVDRQQRHVVEPHSASREVSRVGGEKFFPKGVSYGTFAPDARGAQFPPLSRVADDFALMRDYGINTVRTYTRAQLAHPRRGGDAPACA